MVELIFDQSVPLESQGQPPFEAKVASGAMDDLEAQGVRRSQHPMGCSLVGAGPSEGAPRETLRRPRFSMLTGHVSIFVYSLRKPFRIEFLRQIMPGRTVARAIAVVIVSAVQEIGGKQNDRAGGNDQIHGP